MTLRKVAETRVTNLLADDRGAVDLRPPLLERLDQLDLAQTLWIQPVKESSDLEKRRSQRGLQAAQAGGDGALTSSGLS